MSPIVRVVKPIQLSSSERLDTVRQNGEDEVLLTFSTDRGCVNERLTIHLTLKQATALARNLAGLATTYEEPFLIEGDHSD